ncbi:TIGR03986 family CRISPR-associated RAMP protein [Tychonema sp. LEGE 07199]|uniref:TIGR03986 family type III CRISPR-associated RAMP protein n=1 Tax=unclassified Tychonema TaxID=2642144 RepID=UPI001880F593|nr:MULTISPECIES: TIGR03986 family CRISPR-associated RAMP protein [unclassified Tychonema]MBE9120861.1 TIGR03986 family CRISPR-associated RAMP protein [Tychonema sp. LEGE 07199]MBE9134010.1 TIGR03986 family CRISPR-associated RAMP protein [Tychonema sp. LEGE 07196]
MNPKHIKQITDSERVAKAPYNFVELPEKVVEAELPLPEGDRYHPDRHTGRIECTLTTKSQLYTRCGWSPDDFAKYSEPPTHKTKEERERWEKDEKVKWEKERREILAAFFSYPGANLAAISGSSIRGMLRTLVEIVSFGKIDRVSEQQRFFFRAVAADKDDPLKEEYKKYVKPKNIKAGYLLERQDGWFIRPAMPVDEAPFVWVKEDKLRSISGFIPMNNLSEYTPQYFMNISFQDIYTKNTRRFAGEVSSNCTAYKYQGVIVTSGNMLEGGNNPGDLKRQNHCIIREPNPKAELIPISEDAIQDYYNALTPFQKQEPPFDKNRGFLKNGRCIFYCQPQAGQPVTLFGQSPNFRIPYSHQGNGKASTARDFIPDFLKDSKEKTAITDIAEAIFGFVRRDKQPEGMEQSRAGRVFISNGILKLHQEEKVQQSLNQEPKTILLSSPKPTTFQHYLVQSQETGANKSQLKHYASTPPNGTEPGKTVIRGHKLYWHKPVQIEVPSDTVDTQTSLIKPIDEGINFSFTIYFENLSKVEIGAILWVLMIAEDEKYCFSIGMGKPLGMGAVKVKIDELWLGDRTQRYDTLFTDDKNWDRGEKANTDSELKDCRKAFEDYVLKNIHENDHPEGRKATKLDELPRIEMLLAMLQCEGLQHSQDAEYMTIEPNEYKERRVLPTPLQVAGIDDNRRSHQTFSPSTRPSIVVKSERQVEIAKAVQSKKFEIGQILEATVASINSNKVTYQMLEVLKLTEKEPKKAALLIEGQAVHVKITALKEDGNIKSVKCVD